MRNFALLCTIVLPLACGAPMGNTLPVKASVKPSVKPPAQTNAATPPAVEDQGDHVGDGVYVIDSPPGDLAGVAWVGTSAHIMFEENRSVTTDGTTQEVHDMVLRPLTKDGAGPPTSVMAKTWSPARVITAKTGLPYVLRSLDVYRFGDSESPQSSLQHPFGDNLPRVLDLRLDEPGQVYALLSHTKQWKRKTTKRKTTKQKGRFVLPPFREALFVATTGAKKPHRVFDWDYRGPPETTSRDLVSYDSGDVSRAGALVLTQSRRGEVVSTQLLQFNNRGKLIRTLQRSDIKADRQLQIELLDDGSVLLLTLEGAPKMPGPPIERRARLFVWSPPPSDKPAVHELPLADDINLDRGRLYACANRAWMLNSRRIEENRGTLETRKVGTDGFAEANQHWQGTARRAGLGPNGFYASCQGPRLLLGLDYRDRVVVLEP